MDDAPLWPRVNHRCRLAVVVITIVVIAFVAVVVGVGARIVYIL